jgi:hypothetical protein
VPRGTAKPQRNPETFPDRVELPMCEACGNVGKITASSAPSTMTLYCTGPSDEGHKRQVMVLYTFERKGRVDGGT